MAGGAGEVELLAWSQLCPGCSSDLQHFHTYIPAESHTILKFDEALIVSAVSLSRLLSAQGQVSGAGPGTWLQCPFCQSPPGGFVVLQRELEQACFIAVGFVRAEVPADFDDALGFDLVPGGVCGQGAGHGERAPG